MNKILTRYNDTHKQYVIMCFSMMKSGAVVSGD